MWVVGVREPVERRAGLEDRLSQPHPWCCSLVQVSKLEVNHRELQLASPLSAGGY